MPFLGLTVFPPQLIFQYFAHLIAQQRLKKKARQQNLWETQVRVEPKCMIQGNSSTMLGSEVE